MTSGATLAGELSGTPVIAHSWVWRANLRPLMEMCSRTVGYGFDDSDWDAVDLILSSTDDDLPWTSWGTYPLVGADDYLDVAFAQAVGGDEVGVVIIGAADSDREATLLAFLDVFAAYQVADPRFGVPIRDRGRDREDFGAQNSEPPPSDVTIPLRDVRTSADLHRVLKLQLGFPDFYGMNWDAFRDSITGLVEMPERIVFTGWAELVARLPRDAGLLREILDKYQSSHAGDFTASYE